MAPNKRDPSKVLVGGYVTREFKDEVMARAKDEGLDQTGAVTQALMEWLQKPRPDRVQTQEGPPPASGQRGASSAEGGDQ